MNSPRSIVLIGMMGAGKSSVGRCLQRRTGLLRFDTDEIVATRLGTSISEFFAEHGEEQFRSAEADALATLSPTTQSIIVTDGVIVLHDGNISHLKRLGVVVWLEAEGATLFQRASRRSDRPLLQTDNPRETIEKILAERRPLYAKAADVRVNTTNRNHDEVADIILEEIEDRTAGQ
jgi:shikimate kinase